MARAQHSSGVVLGPRVAPSPKRETEERERRGTSWGEDPRRNVKKPVLRGSTGPPGFFCTREGPERYPVPSFLTSSPRLLPSLDLIITFSFRRRFLLIFYFIIFSVFSFFFFFIISKRKGEGISNWSARFLSTCASDKLAHGYCSSHGVFYAHSGV